RRCFAHRWMTRTAGRFIGCRPTAAAILQSLTEVAPVVRRAAVKESSASAIGVADAVAHERIAPADVTAMIEVAIKEARREPSIAVKEIVPRWKPVRVAIAIAE